MLAVRLMQLFSECRDDFRPLTETLGLMFQIRDDYCNLVDADVGKFLCSQAL
jgi:geranylgeranyl diphosphate synthase, type III